MASRVGAPINVTFGASFTVPSGANAFKASGIWYDGANQAVTNVSGSRITVDSVTAVPSSGSMGTYSVHGRVNSSGSDTWSITKAGFFSEGPTCQVQFYSVADNTNFVRQQHVVGDTSGAISRSVTSTTSDLVDACIMSDGGGTVSGAISGFTAVGTEQTVNADKSRMFQANSPGASSTSITGPANSYPALAIWSVYDAGGTDYELTTNPGSYALTGSSARLRRAAQLRTTAGSYAITGVSARLNLTRRLLASPGSYSLTGSSARTERDALIRTTAGSYALTGSSARLESDRRLEASSGSYSITGSDAELIYTQASAYELLVTPGSYSITGANGRLESDRLLGVSPGSYALTGVAARLNAGKLIRTTAGAYSLTGTSARLESDRALSVSPGSYAITGFSAELDYESNAKELIVTPGAYSITGYPAELIAPTRRSGGGSPRRRGYIVKGQRYWLTEDELAVLLARMLTEVKRAEVKRDGKKPKVLSQATWNRLQETLVSLEALTTPEPESDDEDDEEALMLLL